MKIRAVIFDLDGTLTKPVLDFNQIRKEMGIKGGDILSAIQEMDPPRQQQANSILTRHELHAAQNSKLNDGVPELFKELRKRNISIGLLTRNTRENTLHVADRHQLSIDAIISRHDGPAKPDGFGILKLCDLFGSIPSETMMVGDFLHDLQSAHDAGAIAVLFETHCEADQFKALADYSISHISELINLIDTLEQN